MTETREVIELPNGARIVFDAMPQLRTAAVGVFLGGQSTVNVSQGR